MTNGIIQQTIRKIKIAECNSQHESNTIDRIEQELIENINKFISTDNSLIYYKLYLLEKLIGDNQE